MKVPNRNSWHSSMRTLTAFSESAAEEMPDPDPALSARTWPSSQAWRSAIRATGRSVEAMSRISREDPAT